MSKTITVKEAKAALKYLKTLAPANPKMDDDLEMSIKETIAFMAPDLAQFSKRGFTHKELAEVLNSRGIAIRPSTLNRYLNEYLSANQSQGPTEFDDAKGESPESGIRSGRAKNPKQVGVAVNEKSESPTGQPINPSPNDQEQPYA